MKFNPYAVGLAAGVAGLALVGLWIYKRGIGGVAKDVGGAAVDAVDGVTTGVVTGVSQVIGLPTPADTTTDSAVARWLIDNAGQFEASKWSSAGAYLQAQFMSAGSGTSPPSGSPLWSLVRKTDTSTVDETERLLRRYPAPYVLEGEAPTYTFGA